MKHIQIKLLFAIILLASSSFSAYASDLYRWTDKKGKVHYSDHVPPQYIEGGYRIISEQGLTIHTIAPHVPEPAEDPNKKTAEQIAEERRLLTSYSGETDILSARARKIEDIKIIISLTQENIRLLEDQFEHLTHQASDFEKQGLPIPLEIKAAIATTQDKIVAYQATNDKHLQQLKDIQQFYDKELISYRELNQALKTPGQ